MKIKLQLTHYDRTVTTLEVDQDLFDTVSIVEFEDKFFVYDSQNRFTPGVAKFQQVSKPIKIED